jgi:hypothetical protein
MYPPLPIMFELARLRQDEMFATATARADTRRPRIRLRTLLRRARRAITPAPARIDRPCGHAAQS